MLYQLMTLCMSLCSRSFQSVECVHFAYAWIEYSVLLSLIIDKLLVTVAIYLRQFLLNKCSPLSLDVLQHYSYNSYSNVTCCVCTECLHSLCNDWYFIMSQFFYRSVVMRTSCSLNQQKGSNLIEHPQRLALYVLHSL